LLRFVTVHCQRWPSISSQVAGEVVGVLFGFRENENPATIHDFFEKLQQPAAFFHILAYLYVLCDSVVSRESERTNVDLNWLDQKVFC
jgi:hypothetical protein